MKTTKKESIYLLISIVFLVAIFVVLTSPPSPEHGYCEQLQPILDNASEASGRKRLTCHLPDEMQIGSYGVKSDVSGQDEFYLGENISSCISDQEYESAVRPGGQFELATSLQFVVDGDAGGKLNLRSLLGGGYPEVIVSSNRGHEFSIEVSFGQTHFREIFDLGKWVANTDEQNVFWCINALCEDKTYIAKKALYAIPTVSISAESEGAISFSMDHDVFESRFDVRKENERSFSLVARDPVAIASRLDPVGTVDATIKSVCSNDPPCGIPGETACSSRLGQFCFRGDVYQPNANSICVACGESGGIPCRRRSDAGQTWECLTDTLYVDASGVCVECGIEGNRPCSEGVGRKDRKLPGFSNEEWLESWVARFEESCGIKDAPENSIVAEFKKARGEYWGSVEKSSSTSHSCTKGNSGGTKILRMHT